MAVDAQAVIAKSISEKELSQFVVDLARLLGWKVARWPTWRATGTDPGVPDLLLVRNGRLIFAELKTEKGKVSEAQEDWLNDLSVAAMGADVELYIWRPSSWLSGEIEKVLRG